MKTRSVLANDLGLIIFSLLTLHGSAALADELTVTMRKVTPQGASDTIGTLKLSDSDKGLEIKTHLSDLPPGDHGFHIHEKGSCEPALADGKPTAAASAGGHFALPGQDRHAGPLGTGHLGDLPLLTVDGNGKTSQTLHAPRLKLDNVRGRAFMIHEGGDNYSDTPEALGGGKGRIACGIAS